MRRVIGMDIHRTFAEVVFWEDGRLRHHGRVDMTRSGLEGFGRSLCNQDEVVIEATGNAMSVVRVLSPHVGRVIVANPMQVKAIAHARIKTDKIDAGVLAQLQASGFLAGGLDPGRANRAEAPARRTAQPSRASSHACEERGACDPTGASRAEMPACRPVQPARPCLACAADASRRRAGCDHPPNATSNGSRPTSIPSLFASLRCPQAPKLGSPKPSDDVRKGPTPSGMRRQLSRLRQRPSHLSTVSRF